MLTSGKFKKIHYSPDNQHCILYQYKGRGINPNMLSVLLPFSILVRKISKREKARGERYLEEADPDNHYISDFLFSQHGFVAICSSKSFDQSLKVI
jgi:hypothetical protein